MGGFPDQLSDNKLLKKDCSMEFSSVELMLHYYGYSFFLLLFKVLHQEEYLNCSVSILDK
jgi:hypothetical protein